MVQSAQARVAQQTAPRLGSRGKGRLECPGQWAGAGGTGLSVRAIQEHRADGSCLVIRPYAPETGSRHCGRGCGIACWGGTEGLGHACEELTPAEKNGVLAPAAHFCY